MKLLPCSTCPWRVNKDASAIPNYNRTLAYGLLGTVGDNDDFRPIMECHGTTDSCHPRACNGYLARAGWSNINVRILLIKGEIASPDKVFDACEAAGIELHQDYPSVLQKLERGFPPLASIALPTPHSPRSEQNPQVYRSYFVDIQASLTEAAEQADSLRELLANAVYDPKAWSQITSAAQVYNITQVCTMLHAAADIARYSASRIAAVQVEIGAKHEI